MYTFIRSNINSKKIKTNTKYDESFCVYFPNWRSLSVHVVFFRELLLSKLFNLSSLSNFCDRYLKKSIQRSNFQINILFFFSIKLQCTKQCCCKKKIFFFNRLVVFSRKFASLWNGTLISLLLLLFLLLKFNAGCIWYNVNKTLLGY